MTEPKCPNSVTPLPVAQSTFVSSFRPLPFYVSTRFQVGNQSFTATGMLDTGAADCIIPKRLVPRECLPLIKPSSEVISGVEGNGVKAHGEFFATIFLSESFFRNVKVIVMEHDNLPLLIGRPLLCHSSVRSHKIDYEKETLTLRRKFGQSKMFIQEVPLTRTASGQQFPTSSDKQPLSSLDDKLEWLKKNKGLTLPRDHANKRELEIIADILIRNKDALGSDGEEIGEFPVPVRIPTKEGSATAVKQFPIPQAQQTAVDQELQKMLEMDVIEVCDDPKGWNTPIFCVPKKNGKHRLVMNFKRTLNQGLSPEADMAFQVPSCDDVMRQIGPGNRYFSSLDLRHGYWQCLIHPEDRHKTAFQWGGTTYCCKRLPFGLKMSGQIFSRCIARALDAVTDKDNFKSYIDDVLIYAATFEKYAKTLDDILTASRKSNIKLNPAKCTFLQKEAKFLGRVISEKGYAIDPDNVEAPRPWHAPGT